MAEEGGGGYGDSGPASAIGSAQRLPPPPAPQPPPPGSQAAPAPALAPDQLPHNNTLVALPIVAIENILSFMSYDEISQLRLVRPPPPGTPPPLRRAEVWGGTEGERVPGEGAPREPGRGRRRPSRPQDPPPRLRPPPSAPVSGVRPEAALAPGWGRLSGAPSSPTPKRGGSWTERGRPRGSSGARGTPPSPAGIGGPATQPGLPARGTRRPPSMEKVEGGGRPCRPRRHPPPSGAPRPPVPPGSSLPN